MTDTIAYQTLRDHGAFETRLYPTFALIEASQPRSFEAVGKNFKDLVRYIKGENRTQQIIPMTAPVLTVPLADTDLYTLQFILPEPWIMDTAPLPKSDKVAIKASPTRKIAVLRYSGVWGFDRFRRHADNLLRYVTEAELTPIGAPLFARYDAPFWPLFFMRRNEVWIEIE